MTVGSCKLCGETGQLAESHVIPRALQLDLAQDGETLKIYSIEDYPKRIPIGVYDYIVCIECEKKFHAWDDHAIDVFRRPIPHDAKHGYELAPVIYDRLKLFMISLAWRASVSSQLYYRGVRLGRYEELAKRAICNEDPGGPEDFSVAIMAVKYPRGIVNFAPAISRIDQVNYYKFYLGSFCVYMKFDRRPFVSAAREFVLKDEGFAYILLRDFAENEFFAVGKIGRGVKPVK